MTVVCDTSSISNLLQIGLVSILHTLYGRVLITPAVQGELRAFSDHGEQIDQFSWINVRAPENREMLAQLLEILDLGESESIIVAIESNANYLIIDEYKGRKIAELYGVKISGILGVLIQAKKQGLISSVQENIKKLVEIGFRLDKSLVERVLKSLGEVQGD
mgnify:CR=1 FL=1